MEEAWRARWDLNPGPPAPQAGVIIRQHGKYPVTLDLTIVLDDEPAYAEYNTKIIKTLEQMSWRTSQRRKETQTHLKLQLFRQSKQLNMDNTKIQARPNPY